MNFFRDLWNALNPFTRYEEEVDDNMCEFCHGSGLDPKEGYRCVECHGSGGHHYEH